jgi:predicted Fe-Mo cluster-binding NifX family protein
VAGNFGRNITADLENKGIRTVKASGSCTDAITAL